MRIISRGTDGDGFGCSSVEVAKMMCDLFELVRIKLLALLDLV